MLHIYLHAVYRKAEDMNFHSVCLHVIADSIRRYALWVCMCTYFSLQKHVHFLITCIFHISMIGWWFTLFVSQCRLDIGILVFVPWVPCFIFVFSLQSPLFTSFVFNFCFTHYRVENAEVLCLGLVSAAVVMLVLPLFKATGGILLQMAPPSIPSSALSKCLRQVSSHKGFHSFAMIRVWIFK